VMGPWGRAEAAERWHTGDFGPDSPMARSTKRMCRDCGFFLPLAGSLGVMFWVCGNELSADGHVVDKQYGCGAHSDTPAPAGTGSPVYEPYDDGVLDVAEKPAEPAESLDPTEPLAPPEPTESAEATEPPEPTEPTEPTEATEPTAATEPPEVPETPEVPSDQD
jgi:hypothetical protein